MGTPLPGSSLTIFSYANILNKDNKKITHQRYRLGLARLIEISVNRSIYKRKTIIDMKIQKSVTFNVCSVYLFN